jgi:hypothetical protein
MSLQSEIILSLLTHEEDDDGLARVNRATPGSFALRLTDGAGANQAQRAWSASRALTATTDVINSSLLTDDRGTVNLTALKAVYIKNTGTVTLTFTPGTVTSAWFGTSTVVPGGASVDVAPTAAGVPGGALTVAGSVGGSYDIKVLGIT